MNFLGHSMFPILDRKEEIIFGNICGDFFKGRIENMNLDYEIKEGIKLHKYLDKKTDSNKYFLKSKKLLSKYGLYSGVILDIFNDYFLAKNFNKFSKISLYDYTMDIYKIIDCYYDFLPEKGKKAYDYMKEGNWLYNYNNIDYIEKVLERVSKRFRRENKIYESVNELKNNHTEFEENFFEFWKEMNKK